MEKHKHQAHGFKVSGIGFYLHFIVTAFIVVLLLFFEGRTDYSYKKSFLLGNGVLLCMGVVCGSIIYNIFRQAESLWEKSRVDSEKAVLLLTKILFFLQLYFCYSAYFYSGWDAAVIDYGANELAADRSLGSIGYFSQYPNNLLLVYFFSLLKRVDKYIGVLDVNNGIMCILCVQCFISSLTGLLLFKIVRGLTGYRGAWCAWICYLVLVGSSGWLLIPYSDSVGLLFPVCILYIYQLIQKPPAVTRFPLWGKWFAIGLLSYVGYHIKPQIVIVLIAVILTECIHARPYKKDKIRLLGKSIFYVTAGVLLAALAYNILMKDITKQLDGEKRFGITHYIMMGLNPWNNGGYLYSDVEFSESFPTVSERSAANMEMIGQRLDYMGISGLNEHIVKKLLTNYGDGTFAWKNEGTFVESMYEPKNTFLSPFLRNLIVGEGEMNRLTESIRQMVWLCVLAASLGLAGHQKSENTILYVVAWAILGLTLFELLFEARARYLYIYAPFYIIAATVGAGKIRMLLRRGVDRLVAFHTHATQGGE